MMNEELMIQPSPSANPGVLGSHDIPVVVSLQWRRECRRALTITMFFGGLLLGCNLSSGAPDSGDATADAHANAKSALMLAMDELQNSAGPDQRITARADILGEDLAHPNLTGVWQSWEINASAPPAAADYEKPAKDAKFLGWLVSSLDPAAVHQVSFASQPLADLATLWGPGTLGATAPVSSFVSAAKIPVTSPAGAHAWAVLDEGVKVRINTPYADGASSVTAKTQQLGSGERPGVEFIPGLGALRRGFFNADAAEFADFTKGIGDSQFGATAERLAPGTGDVLKTLTHDVSLHSLGLFTDSVRGGFKQDFQLLMNSSSLPAAYSGNGVYKQRLGLSSSTAPSDPRWESLQQFARLYCDKITNSGGVPVIKTQTPAGWAAVIGSGTTPIRTPPAGVVLQPTIAKVQMLFSLIGRDLYANLPAAPIIRQLTAGEKANGINGPQNEIFRNTRYDYLMHLLYTPLVTLHNPYNVALEFTSLRVEFANVPFAMQIFRNGVAQSTGLVPLDTMYIDNDMGQSNKIFRMNLKTKTNGVPGSATFRLLPGEVKLFTPYIDPTLTYLNRGSFWDIYLGSSLTTNIEAMPGWRGDGIGYTCDWLAGGQPVDGLAENGHWGSTFGLAWDDQIYVKFAPLSTGLSNNRFVIRMSSTVGSATTVTSAIEMNYETTTGLQNTLIGPNGTLRYPNASIVPNYIRGVDMVDRATTQIGQIQRAKPFALLSVRAKTTSGGRDESNMDGRTATKPWCFAHANSGASTQKVVSENAANHSHEIDLQVLDNGTANLISTDMQDRGNFIAGQTSINGVRFGAQYDIPLAPIQTLAELNGANPGGSSGYLPRFAQPIGNSWAHPLIPPESLIVTQTGGNYLDHSFLLNLALYDGFYCSGLADQTGPFGSGKTTSTLAAGYAGGTPLDDPRLLLYRPNGMTAAAFAGEVVKPAAYANIAAWQLMKGAFNINSTSVPAWKAMLASIHDSQAIYNQLDKTSGSATLTALTATSNGKARISRFRLPASKSAADGGDAKDAYWLGAREYSDAELQTLAENIVNQVRLRGPFLSLAEFVNRRLGSGETAQCGALQQAIDDSNLNQSLANAANAGFEIPADKVTTYNYANPAAGVGSSYQGAPGYLTQADLLNVLGNAATPRSDTFTIRSYGEAHDAAGQITASATCEAVVQRLPDWYDPADPAETAPANLVSETNQIMGRRFRLLAFRWLNPDEI